MLKIVITGGSGFIGTNLIELFIQNNYQVLNLDILPPKNKKHLNYWHELDILNYDNLKKEVEEFNPTYIVHLAARTDLNENTNIEGYQANILGVENLMNICENLKSLNRIIVASSMLVCRLGYYPNTFDDYSPNNLYGESKVLTEKIVRKYTYDWVLVRPTSIWGPWFGEPYKNFFNLVLRGYYFNIPAKFASTKTYGFVGNTCKQIHSLLINDDNSIKHNYFYLGDINPINITDWAIRIRKLNQQVRPLILPKWLLNLAAIFGDILKSKLRFNKFPMNSFRFNNMTNDNIILDLKRTVEITKIGEHTNLDEEIKITLNWLKQKNK